MTSRGLNKASDPTVSPSGPVGEPRGPDLVDRRPAPGRLQAVRVRARHPAARRAAPARLRPRAHEGPGPRAASRPSRAGSRTSARSSRRSPASRSTTPSPLTLKKILADPSQVAGNLRAWIAAFDEETRDVIEKFDFDAQIGRLDRAKLLYLVLAKVTEVDLHPDAVSNVEMGYLYEELIRKFSELSNETAGEHFTPREVIRLMVDLLFIEDDEALRTPGIVRTMLDPACGTGGMLSVAAGVPPRAEPGRAGSRATARS